MPHNSYIDVLNFSSPKKLAKYLREIGNDQDKYNSYFYWKNHIEMIYHDSNEIQFANLCKTFKKQVKIDTKFNFKKFWSEEENCQKMNI